MTSHETVIVTAIAVMFFGSVLIVALGHLFNKALQYAVARGLNW